MSILVADFINFFDWQVLQNSFGSAVYALPLLFLVLLMVLKKRKDSKLKGALKLLNNNKKGG